MKLRPVHRVTVGGAALVASPLRPFVVVRRAVRSSLSPARARASSTLLHFLPTRALFDAHQRSEGAGRSVVDGRRAPPPAPHPHGR